MAKTVLIAERLRFHKSNQATRESVCEYMATIQKLAEH